MLRIEATQIMAALLPPAPSLDDNAAPLYQRAFAGSTATFDGVRTLAGGWPVYSVCPDGKDDGGPAADGTKPDESNDDLGLRLEAVEPGATS